MSRLPDLQRRRVAQGLLAGVLAPLLPGCGGGGGSGGAPGPMPSPDAPPPVVGPAWPQFARDAQHGAVSAVASQDLARIAWSTPVDLQPPYQADGSLPAHYGSPIVTSRDTVLLAVRTDAASSYRIEAHVGSSGALLWSAATDYRVPPHNWLPAVNLALAANERLHYPGAAGTLVRRADPDLANAAAPQRIAFYGDAVYAANAAALEGSVYVNTPLTVDAAGNVFFGYVVTGSNAANLVGGGIARIGADGSGSWIAASAAAADATLTRAAMNCAPALSPDGSILYAVVNGPAAAGTVQAGMLLALDASTLAVRQRVALREPVNGAAARVSDNGTSSPTVGPDGHVYFGVLEPVFGQHNARGWLLHFDAQLAPAGVPGSFGWDVTPTVIPAAMVPSYTGTSSYLLALKYNNYEGVGTGDGLNSLAVVDPGAAQLDRFSSQPVMREVLTIAGPTPEPGGTGVYEWCINTMAADPLRRSVLANSEDGILYRWDLGSNTLTQSLRLTAGLGQAYTPTLVGPEGTVYAISNARLFAVRS